MTSKKISGRAVPFALPVIEYTDEHMLGIIEHDLTPLQTKYMLYLLGNMDADTGLIHQHRPSLVAKEIGCDVSQFYGEEGLISALNATGMFNLYFKKLKICGKVLEPPKIRVKRKDEDHPFPVKIGLIHNFGALMILRKINSKADLRLLMLLSFFCDQASGFISDEKRPKEWAEMIGMHRTSVERATDWLNENGYCQLKRDYVVTGRLNYTAMGKGFLNEAIYRKELAKELAEKQGRSDDYDYVDIQLKLLKFHGLNVTGWAKPLVREAFEYLMAKTRDKLKKIKAAESGVSGLESITHFV